MEKEDWNNFKKELLLDIQKLLVPSENPRFLTSAEVKKIFPIKETKLYELRRDKKIPFLKIDGKYIYEYSQLLNVFKPKENE